MDNNYEKQVYIARDLFLKYDQTEMIRKFQLEYDENYLYLDLLDTRCRISRSTGEIEVETSSDRQMQRAQEYTLCTDYEVVMSVYDVLCHSKSTPMLANEWCTLHSLQVTMSSPNSDIFNGKYARLFSGKTEQLKAACQSLGGEEPQIRAGADVCWQFQIFPFFPVQMRFWDGDEEFAPKIQLLWDKNSLQFMHFETVYYVMGHLMKRLAAKYSTGKGAGA